MLRPLRSATFARVRPRSVRQRLIWTPTAGRRRSSVVMLVLHKLVLTSVDTASYVVRTTNLCLTTANIVKPLGGSRQMDIAIIGAGNVGTALATSFARAGHTVIIASRDPEDAGRRRRRDGRPRRRLERRSGRRRRHRRARDPVRQRRESRRRDRRRRRRQDGRRRHQPHVVRRRRPRHRHQLVQRRGPGRPAARRACREGVQHAVRDPHQADPFAEGVQLDGFVAADDADAKAQVLELVASIGLAPGGRRRRSPALASSKPWRS